ncbi:MAG: metalloregulator ArsR/SmtB family transcription factor [Syntrophaceae bacterium]
MIHPETVKAARSAVPDDGDRVVVLARLFKAYGDPTRLKILFMLAASEMCVCDIAAALGMQHSAVSHQLTVLLRSRLVRQKKQGKAVYYSLSGKHVKALLFQGFDLTGI